MEHAIEEDLRSRVEKKPLKPGNGVSGNSHILKFEHHCVRVANSFASYVLVGIIICSGVAEWWLLRNTGFAGFSIGLFVFMMCMAVPVVILCSRHWKISLVDGVLEFKDQRVALSKVKALQVVRKQVQIAGRRGRPSAKSYSCWELNFVLDDATRLHFYTNGDRKQFEKDVKKLAAILRLPIWECDGDWHPEE